MCSSFVEYYLTDPDMRHPCPDGRGLSAVNMHAQCGMRYCKEKTCRDCFQTSVSWTEPVAVLWHFVKEIWILLAGQLSNWIAFAFFSFFSVDDDEAAVDAAAAADLAGDDFIVDGDNIADWDEDNLDERPVYQEPLVSI